MLVIVSYEHADDMPSNTYPLASKFGSVVCGFYFGCVSLIEDVQG